MTKKPASLVAATILCVILGLLELAIGIGYLFLLSFLNMARSPLLLAAGNLIALAIGMVFFIWGVANLVAAYGLWELRRYGGIIALVSASLGIIGVFILLGLVGWASSLLNLIIIILVAIGWNNLK